MIEKKATVVAVIVALTLIGAPLAASATPIQTVKTIGTTFHTEDEDEHEDEDDDDDEDDEDDDEDDEDDDHNGYIPPVFVVPGHKKPHHDRKHPVTVTSPDATASAIDPITGLPVQTSSIDPITGQEFMIVGAGGDPATGELGGVNPEEARAVDIRRVPAGMHSPADQFMDAAYIGMGMLGIAALGLGGTAAVRAIRLRRSGKSDYFYGDK